MYVTLGYLTLLSGRRHLARQRGNSDWIEVRSTTYCTQTSDTPVTQYLQSLPQPDSYQVSETVSCSVHHLPSPTYHQSGNFIAKAAVPPHSLPLMQTPLRRQTLRFLTTASSRPATRICSVQTLIQQSTRSSSLQQPLQSTRTFSTTSANMSFSNTDTGNKPADPYTQKNAQDPSLQEKVEDLTTFIDKCKFCMMTTMTGDGKLASRCMALAAKVSAQPQLGSRRQLSSYIHAREPSLTQPCFFRRATASTSSSTPTPNPARPTTSTRTQRSTSASSTPQASGPRSAVKRKSRPTARRCAPTTRPRSRPGWATSATASTTVAPRTRVSVSSRFRPRLRSMRFPGARLLVARWSSPRVW